MLRNCDQDRSLTEPRNQTLSLSFTLMLQVNSGTKAPECGKEKDLFTDEIVRVLKNEWGMAIMMRDRWSLAIHHEDRREGSLISEKDFIRFADVHATMKNNKGRRFVVRISKTASTMEIQAIHNLRNLGYLVEAQFRARTPSTAAGPRNAA